MLKRPCPNCPFSESTPGFLRARRAQELVDGILSGHTFDCHKTVGHDEDGEPIMEGNLHCAGAAIFLEKLDRPNQLMRIFERLGGYDREKLDMDADVFDDPDDFVQHHTLERDPRG